MERRIPPMKTVRHPVLYLIGLFILTTFALAARVGDAAPDFTATDSNGKTHHLADYKGKYVVLEWHNQGCPYTKKHYESGNMQRLQKEWTDSPGCATPAPRICLCSRRDGGSCRCCQWR